MPVDEISLEETEKGRPSREHQCPRGQRRNEGKEDVVFFRKLFVAVVKPFQQSYQNQKIKNTDQKVIGTWSGDSGCRITQSCNSSELDSRKYLWSFLGNWSGH